MKTYELHEIAYKRLRSEGKLTWADLNKHKNPKLTNHLVREDRKIIKNILTQPWAPQVKRILELGCGAGNILRDICSKNDEALGIDVSCTAIKMAKEQTVNSKIKFMKFDFCKGDTRKLGKFDLVIDGHCLHCITDQTDREKFLNNAYKVLDPSGLFIVMAMCSPVDRSIFREHWKNMIFLNGITYHPFNGKGVIKDAVEIKGQKHIPTRYIGPWKDIVKEVETAGFHIQSMQHEKPYGQAPNGSLVLAAIKK